MQQFGRILTEDGVVPVMFDRNQPLDLRTLVSDITPDVIASGALADVDTAHLSAVDGSVTYLAPIDGIRQAAATGFNYRKHIAEFNMNPPAEPEVFRKVKRSVRPVRSRPSRPQPTSEARLGDGASHRHQP